HSLTITRARYHGAGDSRTTTTLLLETRSLPRCATRCCATWRIQIPCMQQPFVEKAKSSLGFFIVEPLRPQNGLRRVRSNGKIEPTSSKRDAVPHDLNELTRSAKLQISELFSSGSVKGNYELPLHILTGDLRKNNAVDIFGAKRKSSGTVRRRGRSCAAGKQDIGHERQTGQSKG